VPAAFSEEATWTRLPLTRRTGGLRLDAATLAFALLRFGAGAVYADRSATPKGTLHAGAQCYQAM